MTVTSERSRWTRVATVLTIVALAGLAGCGDDSDDGDDGLGADPSASTTSTTQDDDGSDAAPDPLRYRCAGGDVDAASLEEDPPGDGGAEAGDDDVAVTLRQGLAREAAAGRSVPERGWRPLSVDDAGEGTLHEFAHGSPPDLWVAVVQVLADGDRVQAESVSRCTPQAHRDGALTAYWWPTGSAPSAQDTTIEVAVQEDSCDSGRGPDGRLLEPHVRTTDDAVTVTFFVEPREGDDAQTCESHPPATTEIHLDEPLGDRELLDGSTYPARTPVEERPEHLG